MADGTRSLLAPWVGGAANPPAPATPQGYRSMMAFWAGGASNFTPTVVTTEGPISLMAFWMGGAANNPAAIAIEQENYSGYDRAAYLRRRKINANNLATIMACIQTVIGEDDGQP